MLCGPSPCDAQLPSLAGDGGESGAWGVGGCSPPSPAWTLLPFKLFHTAILFCLRVRQVVIHPEILIKTL